MKKLIHGISNSIGKINRQHVQIFLALLTLGLLVLGAGAPGVSGGPGGF